MAEQDLEQAFLQAQTVSYPTNDNANFGGNDAAADDADSDDYDPSAQDYSLSVAVPENNSQALHDPAQDTKLSAFNETPLGQPPSRPISSQLQNDGAIQSKQTMRGGFMVDDDDEDEADEEQSVDIDPYEPAEITESAPSVAATAQGTVDSSSHVPVPSAQAESIPTPAPNGAASPISFVQNGAVQQIAGNNTPAQNLHDAPVKAPSTSNGVLPNPTAALPKVRLPHDRVGILEDRIKEDPRGDMTAWFDLIREHKDRNKYQETCRTYDRFFKTFPSAAEKYMEYAQWESDADRLVPMEKIFASTLLQIPHVGLWEMYLKYVRRRNPMRGEDGRAYKIISDAFDFALKNIGIDKDSGEIWKEYLDFLKAGPGVIGGNNWQDTQKMDTVRAAFKRAVCVPTSALESIWKDYNSFEMSLNKVNARKLLQERTANYMDARSAYVQMQNITRVLDRTTLPRLPPAPGFQGSEEYMKQVELWNAWIRFEKEDGLVLREHDPTVYRDRILFTYKQALMALRFWPEMWYSAAEFCFQNGLENQGSDFLKQGVEANPESPLLAFKSADRIELNTSNDEAQDPGNKNRMGKVQEPYNKVLDALYELITKTKAKETKTIAQLQAEASAADISANNDDRPYAEDDDDVAIDQRVKESQLQAKIDTVKQGTEATIKDLSKTLSHVWIGLLRAGRRIMGQGRIGNINNPGEGFRGFFGEARKRGRLTRDVYIETALIEYHCYKDPTATKIFERGMKLFPDDEVFALEYLKHLIAINDITNARAVFETNVGKLTTRYETVGRAKSLFSYMHEYESHFGDLTQIVKLEKRMKDLYPEDPELKLFSTRFSSHYFDPTAVHIIVSPQQTIPRSAIIPSIEQESASDVESRKSNLFDGSVTNSPKRPLPDDLDDEMRNGPRKFARGESPLKGAAGRRLDAQTRNRNVNSGQGGLQPLPPPPLPSHISFLLSIIPNASKYADVRFDAAEMVKLLKDVRLPTFPAWQQEQQARQQYRPPSQPMHLGSIPGMPMPHNYAVQRTHWNSSPAMLPHAARQRNALRCLEREAKKLHLPWLCPALNRRTTSIAHRRKTALSIASSCKSNPISTRHQSKRLASAATSIHVSDDPYVPFSFGGRPTAPTDNSKYAIDHSSLFPSEFIFLDRDGAGLPAEVLRRKYGAAREIGGDEHEIYCTFDACLQVQRYERARALAHRLSELLPENSPEIRQVFNRYLGTLVSDMIRSNKLSNMEQVNTWIEVDMKKAVLDPDATTFAYMIKAAIHSLSGSKRDRTVRRYWNIVKQRGEESEVASLQSILTDQDLGLISQICPMDAQEIESLTTENFDTSQDPSLEQNLSEAGSPATNLPSTSPSDLDIREVAQKGEGMISLKKALSMFNENISLEQDGPDALGSELGDHDQYQIARQRRLEEDALRSAIERWRREHEQLQKVGVALDSQLKSLGAQLWEWHQELSKRLREEVALCKTAEQNKGVKATVADKNRWEYGPFLSLVDTDQLAALAILTALARVSPYGNSSDTRMATFVTAISKAVETEAVAHKMSKTLKEELRYSKRAAIKALQAGAKKGRWSRYPLRDRFDGMQLPPWPTSIHAKVGAVISSHLFDVAKIKVYKNDPKTGKRLSNLQPVFTQYTRYEYGKRKTFVALHSAMDAKLKSEPPSNLIAKHVPMVAKPRRWSSFNIGGYLTTPTGFLRIKNGEVAQRKYAEAAMERGDLDGYFTALNILGETGWRINHEVFRVIREAWNTGEAIANLAPEDPVVEMPPRPTSDDQLSQRKWASAVTKAENIKAGHHSNRCFQNFQLEIARAFINDTFYLPHNIDFRGRAYPIPPYLHQMGPDHCRGLLLFDEGRELGKNGLRWLKIHFANVYGFDKASLSDREAFAMEHMDDIKDSTDNPLGGRKWWLKAEDPWQCLATAFELRHALESPDPTKYVSHLPIHQDGSCNGLQHYAALGGDLAGAQQVNLEPGDRPSDVYTGVSELVKAELAEDAAEGNELAQLLKGKMTRKIVKQTVMTNVYGVTFLGAMRQVRRRLEELHPEFQHHPTGPKATKLSAYIARKIFRALGTLFSGAHDIQFWLGDCATRINSSLTPEQLDAMVAKYEAEQAAKEPNAVKDGAGLDTQEKPLKIGSRKISAKAATKLKTPSFRCSVTWTTPLKLPVVQPYRDVKSKRISTHLQNISISSPTFHDNVHKRKQLQAFPPNFIHSLDATHMMLSAIKCREIGLTFTAVHDSFWTHAADVDRMSELLRDEFVRMHSENIIGRLAAEFTARYDGNIYQASVPKGTKLAEKIQAWRQELAQRSGLSVNSSDLNRLEVLTEHKRQKLLKSSDAEEQRLGREMTTGASIFEAEGQGDKSLFILNSLGQSAIGHVPEVTSEKSLKKVLNEGEESSGVDLGHTLLPGAADQDSPSDDSIPELREALTQATSDMEKREKKKQQQQQRKTKVRSLQVWLPISFPEIPKR
ncbi:MAG: hypothetical protein Q9227_008063, partial [Pyrenula ochraceoflavens]